MITFLSTFQVDRNSFWLGFIAGALLIWILSKLRVYVPGFIKFSKQTVSSAKESLSTGVEQRLRLDIVRFSQHQHLASTMFSLDEVAMEPVLMAPPVQVAYDNQSLPIDTINLTIPYVPDWPELGAVYQTPKISIYDVLHGGANLALAGNPGSGKTTALALLASKIARRDPRLGELVNLLPLFVHAVELNYLPSQLTPPSDPASETSETGKQGEKSKTNTPAELLIETLSRQVSKLTLPRLPGLIQTALNDNRVLLLLDGLDELPPDQVAKITIFIKDLLEQFPRTRIIAAVSFNNLAQLPAMGFHTYAMSAWGDNEKAAFIQKWGLNWEKLVLQSEHTAAPKVDQAFLNNWLSVHSLPCSPLETTLKVWAAYNGDILGADNQSAIEAYLRRMTIGKQKARAALESLAHQMVIGMQPAIQAHQIEYFSAQDEHKENPSDTVETQASETDSIKVTVKPVTNELVNTGMIQSHSGARLRFSSPVIAGYLAGNALVTYGGLANVQVQPTWSGKSTALCYMSYFGDITPAIQYLYKQDDFLRREQLEIARYLQVAPKNRTWRSLILRTLVTLLQKEKETPSLCAKVITAIALSGDPGVIVLFRQMLQSDSTNLRLLSALACGIVGDPKSVDDLSPLLQETSPAVVRAACLALVAIGDKRALEIVADTLLHGSEQMRRSAAEALANHPGEGHPALEEGSTLDDLMVRRSVIYGLMRIRQPWAIKIIERMQLEEKEWIVRTAAVQAIEEIYRPGAYVPKPLPDLTETQWLIDYAAKQGVGVAPGKPAYELVLQALRHGTDEERLQALDYLKYFGDEGSVPLVYSWYFGGTGEIRDAAYNTLWSLANSGVSMPPPMQFGYN